MIHVKNLAKVYKTPVKHGSFVKDLLLKSYEEKRALNDISFDIGENELVGFIGPNGAGKTTTLKILSGILYPTHGTVEVLNHVPFKKESQFLKQIGFIMGQKNQLLWELPAIDTYHLYKEIYELDETRFKETLHELVDMLQAESIITKPVKTLSLGQRMRVELIGSLIHQPKILFLDEPTIGLDIFAQTTIRNFIKDYQDRFKATIILTSHYMQDVEKLAKRVIMINEGNIIYDGGLGELLDEYSDEKIVKFTLEKELSSSVQEKLKGEYKYPMVTVRMKKKRTVHELPELLKKIEFSDMTVEDEPIEEVIKRIFLRKK